MNDWKKGTVLAALSAAVLFSGVGPAYAADAAGEAAAAKPAAAPAAYALNSSLQAEVKSIAAERTAAGVRVGVVALLRNTTNQNTRVPDYELHVRTAEGVVYKLEPSAANSRFLRPQSEEELGFMVEIEGVAAIDISNLQWVDVDYYVYPKKETVILNIPVNGNVWQGAEAGGGLAAVNWGQPFEMNALESSLVYTPVALNEQTTPAGIVKVIKLRVKNTGTVKKTVPALTVEANDGTETFAGRRAEAGDVVLQPNEETFVHLVLPAKPNSTFANATIGTAESFVTMVDGSPQRTEYRVGHAKLNLPAQATPVITIPSYKLGDAVDLSKFSDAIPGDVNVALMEMSMFEPQGAGYRSIVAKFKVENKGTKTLSIPPLQMEIVGENGSRYVGVRQSNAAAEVLPGLATVVSYVFTVPSSETGHNVTLKLQEPVATAEGTLIRSDLVGVKLDAQQPGTDRTFSFYPYTVTLNSKTLTTIYNLAEGHSYKLKLNLEIEKAEQVVTDRDFSLMEVEIVDPFGRTLGSTELSFISNLPNGNLQLMSGDSVVYFSNIRTEQSQSNLTINIYEKIQTENGNVKRLITTIQ